MSDRRDPFGRFFIVAAGKDPDAREILVREIHLFPDGGLHSVIDFQGNRFSYSEVRHVEPGI